MSWSDDFNQGIPDPVQSGGSPLGDTDSGTALFSGDTGELSLAARRVLVQLLMGPTLDSRRHPKLWVSLMGNEKIIRSRLSDVFLELVIDQEMQVAFTRQADTGELEITKLLRRSNLTFIASVLMLFLRSQLSQAQSRGERAVCSTGEIVAQLRVYEKSGSTDRAGFDKKVLAAIERAKEYNILQKIAHTEDRYEISPTLKLLFSAEEIQALQKQYLSLSQQTLSGEDPETEDGQEE